MTGPHISVILLPTLKCNVECDYCFEEKTGELLTMGQFEIILDKLLDHMTQNRVRAMTIYWQGGEIMTLPPQWFLEAHELIKMKAFNAGVRIINSLQTNMIGYSERWVQIIRDMFGNNVGTSMDFPNLHRRVAGSVERYNEIWGDNVRAAREAGIDVGVIALPNPETLRLGAERFYSFFVDELGIDDFQVNMPFPGGPGTDAKSGYPLEPADVGRFMEELADAWLDRGVAEGVRIGPLDALHDYFETGQATMPCIWEDDCSQHLVSIDAKGNVAQCDCWVTSYPECSFGNIFDEGSFSTLLAQSPARKEFKLRPVHLMQHEDCVSCEYLALCHGGCPVRTYSVRGNMHDKDPYCETYKMIFGRMAHA